MAKRRMQARKYSVAEIDIMRSMIPVSYTYPGNVSFEAMEREQKLRTYMLNGTTLEELLKQSQRDREERCEKMRAALQVWDLRKTFLGVNEPDPIFTSRW